MTDQSLFNSNSEQESTKTEESNASSTEGFADLLSSVKNEQGQPKYDSVSKAFDGLRHAQEYIPELKTKVTQQESEINELREKLNKAKAVEDVLEGLKASQGQESQSTSGLDEAGVTAVYQRLANEQAAQTKKQTNVASVVEAIKTKFGDKAEEQFYAKATELGMSADAFNELASNSPQAVLSFFNTNQTNVQATSASQSSQLPSGKVSTGNLPPAQTSMMGGATSRDLAEEMRRHKDAAYQKHGVVQR